MLLSTALRIYRRVRDWRRRPSLFRGRVRVRFGPGVRVTPPCSIGDYTFVGAKSIIGPNEVMIGRYCSIGPETLIGPNSHPLGAPSTSAVFYSPEWGGKQDLRPAHNTKRVEIGNDVWIGTRAIVMPGVRIGDGAIVGAAAVVTRDVLPYSISAGIPARHIRFRFDPDQVEALKQSRWWENDLSQLDVDAFRHAYTKQPLTRHE